MPISPRATPLLASDLLDDLMVLDNELQTMLGGDDEWRAIKALNLALRYLDTVAASQATVLQVTFEFLTGTTLQQPPPTGLLRLDALTLLDVPGGVVIQELTDLQQIAGPVPTMAWPGLYLSTPGAVSGYAWEGDVLQWDRPPDQAYPIRGWGLLRATPFVDRTTPLDRPDECSFALTTFASHLLHVSVGDSDQDVMELAATLFRPLLRSLSPMTRTGPRSRVYTVVHQT